MRELSKKNPYYVNVYRYKELVYFCRQYPIWKEALTGLSNLYANQQNLECLFKQIKEAQALWNDVSSVLTFLKQK